MPIECGFRSLRDHRDLGRSALLAEISDQLSLLYRGVEKSSRYRHDNSPTRRTEHKTISKDRETSCIRNYSLTRWRTYSRYSIGVDLDMNLEETKNYVRRTCNPVIVDGATLEVVHN